MRNCCHSSKFFVQTDHNFSEVWLRQILLCRRLCSRPQKHCEYVLKTSWKYFNRNSITWWYVKTSLQDILKMYWRRFCKTSWRGLEDVLKTSWQNVLKTSSKGLEDVLKTYDQDEYIGLDQDVLKTSFEDVRVRPICSSWRRLHQDQCLLGVLSVV